MRTYLAADGSDLPLRHDIEGYHVGQAATFHVLHDDPQISSHQETVHKVDNVLMLAILHDQNLIDDKVFLGLLLEVHLLDGNTFVRTDFVCSEDPARRALANLVEVPVPKSGICIGANSIKFGDDIRSLALPWSLPRSRRRSNPGLL